VSTPAIGAAKPISLETLEEFRQEYLLNGFLYFPAFLSKKEIDYYLEVMYKLDKTQAYSTQRKPRKMGDPLLYLSSKKCEGKDISPG
jgi:hypothetical protein